MVDFTAKWCGPCMPPTPCFVTFCAAAVSQSGSLGACLALCRQVDSAPVQQVLSGVQGRAHPFSLAVSPQPHAAVLTTGFLYSMLQQVTFYRVDIDEDNIAATVAEAGVASVVPPPLHFVGLQGLQHPKAFC